MTSTEHAWAAGFFDGEGCVNQVKRANHRPTLQLALGQSGSDETLVRFQKAMGGLGKIYGPYQPSNPKHQTQWLYRAHGAEARECYKLLAPYLSSIKKSKYSVVEPICV